MAALTSPAVAGAGVTGNVAVLKDVNGQQVTYNGHPLYTFADDQAGQVTGQGVQNFFVATPGIAADQHVGGIDGTHHPGRPVRPIWLLSRSRTWPTNMTLTRSASAGAGRRRAARAAAATMAVAALGAAAVSERASITASFAVLGHLHWLWIPAAIAAEAASMAAFAFMLRRLLATGGARVGVRSMLATSFAANALSVSIPVAGPELATAFTFRRFTRQGADAPLAGWALLAGGVVSRRPVPSS